MSPKHSKLPSTKKNSTYVDRIILDLKLKGCSTNEIKSHLLTCHDVSLSHRQIRKIIINYGQSAKSINHYYDTKVFPRVEVLEADEIYQGRNGINIGVMDKGSGYLIALKPVEDKNAESFLTFFTPFSNAFSSLKLCITDGLPTYRSTLETIFPQTPHTICHVHVFRDVLKAQEPYNRVATQCYKKVKDMQEKVVSLINRIKSNEKVIKNCDREIVNQESVRDAFLMQHRIRKYSKSKESAEIRAHFRNDLNKIRSYKREYEKKVRKQKNALTTAEEELKTSEVKYQEKKIIALQTGKLVHRFKALLDSCWQEFELKRLSFIKILKSSPCKIARNLLKIVQSNVRVFNDKKEEIQAIIHPNRVNTNTIESLFGKYRLFYKKYRKTQNTTYAQAIFELLRLNHNLSLPYTGFDRNRSPLMRIGIHSKFHNAIERLCCQV